MLVSGVQQREPVIHIHMSTFLKDSFPIEAITEYWVELPVLYSRLLLSILYIVVCICQSQSPNLSFPPYLLVTISFHLYSFSRRITNFKPAKTLSVSSERKYLSSFSYHPVKWYLAHFLLYWGQSLNLRWLTCFLWEHKKKLQQRYSRNEINQERSIRTHIHFLEGCVTSTLFCT